MRHAPSPQPDGTLGEQTWGPLMDLDPVFVESDFVLLGRADVFRYFTVVFEEAAAAPVFHLDYNDGAA